MFTCKRRAFPLFLTDKVAVRFSAASRRSTQLGRASVAVMYTWFAGWPAFGRLALVFGTFVKRADRVRSIDESAGSQEGATQMKLKKMMLALSLVAMMAAPAAFAVDGPVLVAETPAIQPVPDAQASGAMPEVGAQPVPVQAAPVVTLYTNVRYRDERKIAPCAVP